MSAAPTSLSAGAAFLLVIGVLCGLYLGGSEDTPSSRRKPDETPGNGSAPQASSGSQMTAAVQHPAKPSPIVTLDQAQRGIAGTSALTPRIAAPSPRYVPTRFEATHKKMFRGCAGRLELTASRLRFSCREDDLDFPVDAIAKAHKNGIVLKSGEKYHFTIANHTKDQVEAIFISWLNRVQSQPTERAAAF
jgi:hypothetical protein